MIVAGKKRSRPVSDCKTVDNLEQYWDETKNGHAFKDIQFHAEGRTKYYWRHQSLLCLCIHYWYSALVHMLRPSSGIGCPHCISKGIPCCEERSLAGNAKFIQIKTEWHKDNLISPRDLYPRSNKMVTWQHPTTCRCGVHTWDARISERTGSGSKGGCPICSRERVKHSKPCCEAQSVAGDANVMETWDHVKNANMDVYPEDLFHNSNLIVHWVCALTCVNQPDCKHEWMAAIIDRTNGSGCPFHVSKGPRPCCASKSLEAAKYSELRKQWDYTLNIVAPRDLYPNSHTKLHWICYGPCGCKHVWQSRACERRNKGDGGCPYCAIPVRIICCKNHPRSIFQWDDKAKLQCLISEKTKSIETMALGSNRLMWFRCAQCAHVFDIMANLLTRGGWCPYCAFKRACGKSECKSCNMKCEMGSCDHIARRQTHKTRRWYCQSCFDDAIRRDAAERPKSYPRAKVSLEIYSIAELQRISSQNDESKYSFLWTDPSSWDCCVLPGSSRRPDVMYAFNREDIMYEIVGKCKLDGDQIGYVLIVEFIENNRKSHSAESTIPDEDRELEIRNGLKKIPVGILYVTIAHMKHVAAHADDIFFHKVNDEYELLESRREAFTARILQVRDTLSEMFEKHENGTRYIGH